MRTLKGIADQFWYGEESFSERLMTELRAMICGKGRIFFFQAERKACKKTQKKESEIKDLKGIIVELL